MQQLISQVIAQIESVVIGKPKQVKLAIACLLAKGHLLIEDLPGMGKTTLAHMLANTLGLSYQRVQFTSDMLPADLIGVSILDTQAHSFQFHQGPIFNQVVLADEINRASPKTQSALLEAMEESRVSVDGKTYQLPEPFFVIATQNPMYHAGTYPLPESQLDRFMMRLSLGFPDLQAERKILLNADIKPVVEQVCASIKTEQLIAMQNSVNKIHTSESLVDYVIALCQLSRSDENSMHPLSPRAGKALLQAAKAWAFIEQRDFVTPNDIKSVFAAVCEHRLVSVQQSLSPTSQHGSLSEQLLNQVDSEQPLLR